MSQAPGSNGPKIALGVSVFVGIFAILLWRSLQPKIRTATPEEIHAILPKILQDPIPVDSAGRERYQKLMSFLKQTDFKSVEGQIDIKKKKADEAYAAMKRFWNSHPTLVEDFASVLNAGSLQVLPLDPNDYKASEAITTNSRSFIRVVEMSARLSADHGEYEASTKLHLLGISFVDKILKAGGPIINYIVAASNEGIVNAAIDRTALIPGLPTSDCQQLLAALTPAPEKDNAFALSVKEDFLRYGMTVLPDPTRNPKEFLQNQVGTDGEPDSTPQEPIVGTYDAIETTKIYSNAIAITMANAMRPYSKIDNSAFIAIEKDSKQLPQEVDNSEPDGAGKTLKKWKYRFQMNNSHNSLGRQFVSQATMGEGFSESSYRWRAQREATRILLASRLYRSAHGGKLPDTIDGFVPLLGKWPTDPYNGLPMVYNAKTQKVYSVGKNLVDDGGDIGVDLFKALDIGLSLR